MSAQIELEAPRKHPNAIYAFNPRMSHHLLTKSLPFFRSSYGGNAHRIRHGIVHCWDGKPTHTAFHLWCGGTGFIGRKKPGALMAEPPNGVLVCLTCEQKAIKAALRPSSEIVGHPVAFSVIRHRSEHAKAAATANPT